METTSYETEFMPTSEETMQTLLAKNLNQYVICELLIGLRSMTVREGVLIEVGSNYFILLDTDTGDKMSCDLYSLRFVTVPSRQQRQTQGAHGYTHCTYGRPPCRNHGAAACWMHLD